jgi:hypothetical protein
MRSKKRLLVKPQSTKNRIRFDDLAPDGVRILVDWSRFTVGSSVFVPAIDTTELIGQFQSIANYYNWEIDYRYRVEGGRQGLRFWRLV